ncbi:MAG: hypothetical protein JO119_05970 [Acidobacteria bacterium]|nr:hypothetical protein [Acidobacteriota bacterium]
MFEQRFHFAEVLADLPDSFHIEFFVTIGKGVHLFTDNVCVRPDRAGKEICGLQDRRAYFAEVEGGEDFSGGLFDLVPERGFRWQKVARAFDGLEFGFVHHLMREKDSSLS